MLSVSVIIPAVNEQASIADTIDSAVAAGADEVIVVDGGSTDRTVAVAGDLATVITSQQSGRAVQQNAGAAIATGDVLLFLHADCTLHVESISEIRSRLTDSNRFQFGCFQQDIDQAGVMYRLTEIGNQWRASWLKRAYGDQGIFLRADVFRQVGGFPELCFLEDLFLMKRLRALGPMLVIRKPLTISARRWKRRGLINQTCRNWLIVAAAEFGASPNWLAKFYPNDR